LRLYILLAYIAKFQVLCTGVRGRSPRSLARPAQPQQMAWVWADAHPLTAKKKPEAVRLPALCYNSLCMMLATRSSE